MIHEILGRFSPPPLDLRNTEFDPLDWLHCAIQANDEGREWSRIETVLDADAC